MPAASPNESGPSTSDVASARPPRTAATLVVIRDGETGLETLLSRRADGSDHTSAAWVFPGGIVDPGDRLGQAFCSGFDDAVASRRLGVEAGGLDHWIAAIRECFEESGLLFARDAAGDVPDAEAVRRLSSWRDMLHDGTRDIGAMCTSEGLRLEVARLVYFGHWLTPRGYAKRYDTRFFIATLPAGQRPSVDGTEMVEQRWVTPAQALSGHLSLKLLTPTRKTLETLGRFATAADAMTWASSLRDVQISMPRLAAGADGPKPVLPEEPAWTELGRIDPDGRGVGFYDLLPGRAVRLSERVIRVTAGNGSMMTGPGTNTYLVGEANGDWAVIDPGPAIAAHVDAVIAAAPGPIRTIFATHTHTDHSPATVMLRERTGAVVHGLVSAHREWQDASFAPDVTLLGGERIALGPTTTLAAIHTPGHASNHLCYLLEEERTLFTGDHVMQASTVVINPPDGDMRAYVESLRSLLDLELDWLAPGHGFLMDAPRRAMEKIIAHRLAREAKVVDALSRLGLSQAATVLETVYADVPAKLHTMAMRSLTAHLLKLRDDGVATVDAGGAWALTGAPMR